MKTKLNQKLADHLPPIPEGKKSAEYRDIDMPGFLIAQYHTKPEVGTFTLRYRDENAKQRALKIARTDEMSLKQAKAIAKTKKSEIALGGDPSGENEKKRSELTVDQFFMDHYGPYIRSKGLRSAHKLMELYSGRIKKLCGHIRVNALRKGKIQALQAAVRDQGYSAAYANRHVQLIKAAYNVGIKVLEIIDCKNPAVGIPLYFEEGRERFLDKDELARLMPVLMKTEGQYVVPARIIRFELATGLRSAECRHAMWQSIDLDGKIMFIPRARSKNLKADSIPLNTAAISVLEECDRNSSPYPFANLATGKPYVSIKKSMATLMKQAGLEGVTAHVLRHTAASMLINSGHSLYSVQRLLRHSTSAVTEKYAHLSTRSLQDASDSISDQLMKAAEPKEESNVIPLNKKASGEN